MTDFRQQLYERYVSTFKGITCSPSEERIRGNWAWARHKLLPHLAHLDRRAAILELGCGPGYLLELLGQEGFENAVGIDISAEQVGLAKARGIHAVEAEVLAYLEANDASYDAILALDFIEHFSKSELLPLMTAIRGALRPGGTLLLQTPNGEGLFSNRIVYGDLTHLTILNPGSLEQLLRLTGFESIECFETGPAARNLSGRVRVALWSLIRGAANLARRIETGTPQQIWTETLLCRCRRP